MNKFSFLAVIFACLLQANGLILDCSFKISNHSVLENIYGCNAKVIFLSENDAEVQYVFQNHLSGKRNSDVTGLILNDQELLTHQIPASINLFFANLKLLDLKNTSISLLSTDDISPFSKLQVLILMNNLIKILDGKVFTQNSGLIYIDFDDNLLTNTGTKLLEPLTELNYAYFGNNICTDSYVNNTTSVERFKIQLSSNCPPTFDMLVGEILENDIFLSRIDSIISEKINGQP